MSVSGMGYFTWSEGPGWDLLALQRMDLGWNAARPGTVGWVLHSTVYDRHWSLTPRDALVLPLNCVTLASYLTFCGSSVKWE